jgi:hypothetical protein
MTAAPGLEAALAEAGRWIGEVPGVGAVGQGEQDGAPTIDVWVSAPPPAGRLPGRLHGFPVRVRDSGGPFRAQSN